MLTAKEKDTFVDLVKNMLFSRKILTNQEDMAHPAAINLLVFYGMSLNNFINEKYTVTPSEIDENHCDICKASIIESYFALALLQDVHPKHLFSTIESYPDFCEASVYMTQKYPNVAEAFGLTQKQIENGILNSPNDVMNLDNKKAAPSTYYQGGKDSLMAVPA